MIDKNNPNSPYFDDSHLDISIFRIDGFAPDGDIVDSCWVIEEDIDREIEEIRKWFPDCEVKVVPCELRDAPEDRQEDILAMIADMWAQEQYYTRQEV